MRGSCFFVVRALALLGAFIISPALANISADHSAGAVRIGPATDTCNSGIEGAIRYNSASHAHEYCDSLSWKQFVVSSVTGQTSTAPSGTGYFVITNGTWNANLGGPAGANAKCLSDLIANNWMGKTTAVTNNLLSREHVRAWLCPSNACQNAMAGVTYYFAVSNSAGSGGASFTANSSGIGTGDSGNWSGATYFNGTKTYWTGRDQNQTNTTWGTNSNGTIGQVCYNGAVGGNWYYSVSDQNGVIGTSNSSTSTRWNNGGATCATLQHLICFVHPWAPVASCTAVSGLSFSNLTSIPLSTVTTSNIVQVPATVICDSAVSISGGGTPQFRICADSACASEIVTWGSAANVIAAGQYVQMRLTSSATPNTGLTATLVVGAQSPTWSVTTYPAKKAFITSTSYTGSQVGSVAAANTACAGRATAATLSGTFKAWLAVTTGTDDPATTFTHYAGPWTDVSGTVVANSWTTLTSGTLTAGISKNESGTAVGASTHVWTNVASNGSATNSGSSSSKNCTAWTNNGGNPNKGNYGLTSSTTATWTNSSSDVCSTTNRLYCFEQ